MSSFDSLPVILVSAPDNATANEVISELIDNEVTNKYCDVKSSLDLVWRIVNKYYTADVRLHALVDGECLGLDPDQIEAHVIHITEEELDIDDGILAAERRAGAAGDAAAVRVLLVDADRAPDALEDWALRARLELVPLREEAAPPAEPFPETFAWQRARAALHAHAWRGLRRLGPPGAAPPAPAADADAADERAVERAEQFAAALGSLGAAREARGDRDSAEALVRAFCRALGLDPDSC